MQSPDLGGFCWREVGKRPPIEISVFRTSTKAWEMFKRHHYLSQNLSPAAQCWVALCDGAPVAFVAMLHMPQPQRSFWRVSRIVCSPDFQGIGIAGLLMDFVCSIYRCLGKPVSITSGHPGLIRSLGKSTAWKILRAPSARASRRTGNKIAYSAASSERKTASFEYVGPVNKDEARAFGLCK